MLQYCTYSTMHTVQYHTLHYVHTCYNTIHIHCPFGHYALHVQYVEQMAQYITYMYCTAQYGIDNFCQHFFLSSLGCYYIYKFLPKMSSYFDIIFSCPTMCRSKFIQAVNIHKTQLAPELLCFKFCHKSHSRV